MCNQKLHIYYSELHISFINLNYVSSNHLGFKIFKNRTHVSVTLDSGNGL